MNISTSKSNSHARVVHFSTNLNIPFLGAALLLIIDTDTPFYMSAHL